jgi:hypothetical protein
MKKNLLYMAGLSMTLLFTACGGGGSSAVDESSDDLMTTTRVSDVSMKIDEVYTINKGDSIIKVSTAPIIELDTNITSGKTTATLKKGEAKIKKGSRVPAF